MMCFLHGVFVTKLCRWQIAQESKIGITIQFSRTYTRTYCPPLLFSISTVYPRKEFKYGVTGYCAVCHLFTLPPLFSASPAHLMHAITALLFWRVGERRERWRTGKVRGRLRDKGKKNYPISTLVVVHHWRQSCRPPAPRQPQGKRIKSEMWQPRLIPVVILSYQQARCLSDRRPATFHAVMLHLYSHIVSLFPKLL